MFALIVNTIWMGILSIIYGIKGNDDWARCFIICFVIFFVSAIILSEIKSEIKEHNKIEHK